MNSWLVIILILLGVALLSGLLFGVIGEMMGLSPTVKNAGMGVTVGVVAAVLISRRRADTPE